ncbi:phage holin family protein [Sporichthya sp.]|uniref:phage holin family protein n=1 Tax=Sporichthya sp. TaxID=65475 RepID=UPI0018375783|nr:phage holin family protein [Sporichthya sp.]MBA3745163.1 phage holin family protein [Sporichthya sp.]
MKDLAIRLGINAAALWVAAAVVGGIELNKGSDDGRGSWGDRAVMLLIVAAIFATVNAIVKPIATLIGLPLIVVTIGLFIFVINALMLLLTSAISDALNVPFHVEDFGSALFGALVVTLVSWPLSLVGKVID